MDQSNNPDRPRPAPRDPAWMRDTPSLAEVERRRCEKAEVSESMADDPWRPCDA